MLVPEKALDGDKEDYISEMSIFGYKLKITSNLSNPSRCIPSKPIPHPHMHAVYAT